MTGTSTRHICKIPRALVELLGIWARFTRPPVGPRLRCRREIAHRRVNLTPTHRVVDGPLDGLEDSVVLLDVVPWVVADHRQQKPPRQQGDLLVDQDLVAHAGCLVWTIEPVVEVDHRAEVPGERRFRRTFAKRLDVGAKVVMTRRQASTRGTRSVRMAASALPRFQLPLCSGNRPVTGSCAEPRRTLSRKLIAESRTVHQVGWEMRVHAALHHPRSGNAVVPCAPSRPRRAWALPTGGGRFQVDGLRDLRSWVIDFGVQSNRRRMYRQERRAPAPPQIGRLSLCVGRVSPSCDRAPATGANAISSSRIRIVLDRVGHRLG